MMWESMTIDEYAVFQRAGGAKVAKIGPTWWIEARPFFFRPLFPFAEISPHFRKYPVQSLVGGVLHPVPAGVAGNSSMHLFLYDRLKDYSIDKLDAKQRWIVKKGQENFTARRITQVGEFIEQAWGLYRSFYDRTGYFYKKERIQRAFFATWAETIFHYPKIVVTGAYHEGNLSAVDISYQVEDIIIDDVFFSDSQSLPLRVTDFLIHTLREAAKASDARFLFRGFPTGKQSLDESKLRRGCQILKIPAYCRINPLALYVGRKFMNESYKKLIALTSFPDSRGEKPALSVPR